MSQVVEKDSALLEIDGEEQIPVDANHEDLCRFTGRSDDVYEKLFKRVKRMIKEQGNSRPNVLCTYIQLNTPYLIMHTLILLMRI